MTVMERTRRWLEDFVLARDICPFAHEPFAAGEVRITASEPPGFDEAVRAALDEVVHLAETPDVETTLVVYPNAFGTFEELLDASAVLEHLLEEAGMQADVQVVAFHPAFRFEGASEDDPANAVNRSPYPMLHLLRVASVRRAIEGYPDAEGIAERNKQKLRDPRAS